MTSVVLVVLALLGVPLFAVIAAGAMIGFHSAEYDLQLVAIEMFRLADMPVLVAIPLFTLAGYMLGETKAPDRLVRLTEAWLGWLPGGLPIVVLVSCAIFTALTGASGITIVALGALLFPALNKAGYPERFNLGLVTSSGSLGLLFAPALPLILYAVVAQQVGTSTPVSVDDLFLAGILPGLFMMMVLALYSAWVGRKSGPPPKPFHWPEAKAALIDALGEIPLPFIILGGIYGGIFAVSEAAVVTIVYVFVVTVVFRRELSFSQLPGIIHEAMMLVGAILIILGVSLASTNYVIDAEIPYKLLTWFQSWIETPVMFIAVLIGLLLLLGMLLDIFSALVIVVPILLPAATQYGIDPVHLGILFLAAMQIGYFTPPIGMNLFIASYRFERPILELCRAAIPFFLLLLACVVVIGYWPQLSLMLIR